MRVAWDRTKNLANQKNHGISFQEASELFISGVDYLELFDQAHSYDEDRFIAVGPIRRGLCWSSGPNGTKMWFESSPRAGQHDRNELSFVRT